MSAGAGMGTEGGEELDFWSFVDLAGGGSRRSSGSGTGWRRGCC
ncbi:hypothetical protein ACFQY7_42825 [Actinomadura luteofluorescens]